MVSKSPMPVYEMNKLDGKYLYNLAEFPIKSMLLLFSEIVTSVRIIRNA